MKILLVSGSVETFKLISSCAKPLGFEIIRYNHIIKAMDNIDEIDPSCVIISARDFPRQWKTMTQFLRSWPCTENCPVILLSGDKLDPKEEAKAKHLTVSCIVPEEPEGKELDRLQEVLKSCIRAENENSVSGTKVPRFSFVFTIPGDIALITGKVKAISADGLSFLPDNAEIKKSLKLNMEFSDCSLRAGEAIINPVCCLVKTEPFLEMKFISFHNGEQEILNNYL